MRNNTKDWRAVYTKPRSEKKLAERLEQQGIEVYCPVQTTLKQWSDRKKKVSVPIFPSYVFLRLSEKESDLVLQDPGVLNFVYWLGQPALIRDEEIEGIRAFLSNYRDSTIVLVDYEKGDKVEIIEGPFKGQAGTIMGTRSETASLVVKSLRLLIKVELNANKIERAE